MLKAPVEELDREGQRLLQCIRSSDGFSGRNCISGSADFQSLVPKVSHSPAGNEHGNGSWTKLKRFSIAFRCTEMVDGHALPVYYPLNVLYNTYPPIHTHIHTQPSDCDYSWATAAPLRIYKSCSYLMTHISVAVTEQAERSAACLQVQFSPSSSTEAQQKRGVKWCELTRRSHDDVNSSEKYLLDWQYFPSVRSNME